MTLRCRIPTDARSVHLSLGGKTLYVVGPSGDVTVFRTSDGHRVETIPTHSNGLAYGVVSRTGASLAVEDRHGVRVIDLPKGTVIGSSREAAGLDGRAFSEDGAELVCCDGTSRRTVLYWRKGHGAHFSSLGSAPTLNGGMAISKDGSRVAFSDQVDIADIWTVEPGQRGRRTLYPLRPADRSQETGYMTSALMFSPDGSSLVIGGVDRSVRMWNFTRGKLDTLYPGDTH